MYKLEIIIDNRERDLIELFNSNESSYSRTTLEIGDIQFLYSDNYVKNLLFMVIERKSLSDLSSSITDGRYKEQKQRLLHSISPKIRKIYIIEGIGYNQFNLDPSVLDGVMINTVIRDKIMIYRTDSLEDTYNLIRKMERNLENYIDDIVDDIRNVERDKEYQIFKMNKKENYNGKIVFKGMLSIIPQVSNSITEVLYERYKNIDNMIQNLRNESNGDWLQMIKILGDIKYGSNQRRMGDIVAKKIILYIMDMTEEERERVEDDNFGKPEKKKRNKKMKEEKGDNQDEEKKEVKKERMKNRWKSRMKTETENETLGGITNEYLFSDS